ncbi:MULTISPECIES: hypothetical protein [Breznakia]|uniref:Thioredoxin n=1 Tax=Breznakia blatticola TaxID=1754012 RepID=A0A4R8A8L3_9FIRM|nr:MULTISPECIES: hypothetical protein [Breznakia]MDH6367970.1 thioredoxin-related protein [Breznakia sp. PH1-1]MDH6405058.1 thioredoxin-related protein [Breznakia sp. PF1-11]MDH6412773.1 thioredoxin-related protein [Breznakia sp. PFB1-11]MDH6415133.1 thioredoxin-related protein [Breznakia sp. PFB1-14]MDH6417444.1 thioredoxin-related protein [Breznakia sp. PFB1-4]
MKKLIAILTCTFLVLSGCSSSKDYERDTSQGKLEEITFEQFKNHSFAEGDAMVVLSQTTCSHCKIYKEDTIIPYLLEHNVTVYELNFTNEEDPKGAWVEVQEMLDGKFTGTPATLIVNGDELKETVTGEVTLDDFDDLVVEYQLDKKK